MDPTGFQWVLAQGNQLQARLADLAPVVVGGTAVAALCRHRVSFDVDAVTPHLTARYDETRAQLESWVGWRTNRVAPRVMILGEREGVELGVRQQRRPVPLRVTRCDDLVVPTPAELLRVKAFLLVERRAVRDFVDVAALREWLGLERALRALRYLNAVYGVASPLTWASRFAEACEALPTDLGDVRLPDYKGLRAPFDDWKFVAGRCRELGRAVAKAELSAPFPLEPDAGLTAEETA
jgi:hypothetical protein